MTTYEREIRDSDFEAAFKKESAILEASEEKARMNFSVAFHKYGNWQIGLSFGHAVHCFYISLDLLFWRFGVSFRLRDCPLS